MVCQVDCQLVYINSNRDTSSGLLTSHGHDAWSYWHGIVGMGRIHVARQINHCVECYLCCHPCGGNIRISLARCHQTAFTHVLCTNHQQAFEVPVTKLITTHNDTGLFWCNITYIAFVNYVA